MCHRVICSSSIASQIIANPEEELVSLIYTNSAAALLILFYLVHAVFFLCAALFEVALFPFDIKLWT